MNLFVKTVLKKARYSKLYLKTKKFFSTDIRPRIKANSTLERSPKVEEFTHNNYFCQSHKGAGGFNFGSIPDYYTTAKSGNNEMHHYSIYYYIDKIFGNGHGSGTADVQKVLLRSLRDKQTRGRILLDAECIDGKTHPAGFYYKLGFRHTNEKFNIELEKWLKEGGKRQNAPRCSGEMYLPRENILHCLYYGNATYSLKDRLLIKCYMLLII